MDRPVIQPERPGRGGYGVNDALLLRRGLTRGRDVNRLLEKRTVERVRLVEDRERNKRAAREHSFDGELGAGNERFDQHPVVRVVMPDAYIGRQIGRASWR